MVTVKNIRDTHRGSETNTAMKTFELSPHVYKFPDYENLTELLASRSRRDVLRFNNFMWRIDKTPRIGARLFADSSRNNKRIGETILRILDLSNHLPTKSDNFPESCFRILNADSIDDFEKLDKDVQHQVWYRYYVEQYTDRMQTCADRAYLRLLHMTGMPVQDVSFHADQVEDYMTAARSLHSERAMRGQKLSREIDLSDPSDDFVHRIFKTMRDYKFTSTPSKGPRYMHAAGAALAVLEPYRMQIILMLRALYAEAKIFEMIDHFSDSEQCLCAEDLLNLLEEWDNLREYPVEWIRQMKSLEH